MSVIAKQATIYYSQARGRNYLSKSGAIRAEAVQLIKSKHPTEGPDDFGNGFYWEDLPRSEVILRRMMRLIRQSGVI